MADFNAVAKEVFQVLRSFNYNCKLYDDNGMQVQDGKPDEARRFMAYPKNLMVALLDDDDNSRITLSMGKSVHANDVMGLIQKLRTTATSFNMIFKVKRYGKVINPKQFAQLASITERRDFSMQVCEGMYGTSRSSYLRLEHARMIVRHKQRIDDSNRGRHVKSIHVENATGERNRLPTTNLWAGRAMMQHVNEGGQFADPKGQQINLMAIAYHKLARTEGANGSRIGKLRKMFERLCEAGSETAPPATTSSSTGSTPASSASSTSTSGGSTAASQAAPSPSSSGSMQASPSSPNTVESPSGTGSSPASTSTTGQKPVTEKREEATMDVLGKPVGASAWQAFWSDMPHINFIKPPAFPHLGAVVDKIAYQLHQIAQVVQDDGLHNLFDTIASELPSEQDPQRRRMYRAIAKKAIDAVNKTERAPLADQNPNVVEHLAWLNRFDPDQLFLKEQDDDPTGDLEECSDEVDEGLEECSDEVDEGLEGISPMDPSYPHDMYDEAFDNAILDFSGDDFVNSEYMQDILGDHADPEENSLSKDEIMSALESYLRHSVEIDNPSFTGDLDDTMATAEAVYDEAVRALHDQGYVVTDNTLAESEELTIEDILLPKKDQGADMVSDVTKTDITDPDDPEHHEAPNAAYIRRMEVLSGIRSGEFM